ncbi:hypothetical protein TSUD_301630 [Trifolium subterraneum]|uniref:Reverse transcriptase domain-containing protein n=1 Tax=Trifolium subterraneum TaxID=3900 RepID=A0A2Z6NNL9_TRISU|nr:hypothetical protein TSUD_301630 [Trifolium subterraneum]
MEDKKGNHPHPNWLCNGFRSAVCDCDLTDIHLEGYPYTWIKSRGTPNVIEERLDRAMANSEWLMNFPRVKLVNLITSHSDHSPILLQNSPMERNVKTFSFRFENSWLKEDGIGDVVEEGWGRERCGDITIKTARCAEKLKGWGRRKRTRFKQELQECSEEMERMRDLNTKFFHMTATSRQRAKKIGKIMNEDNNVATTQPELCEVALNYFNHLFKSNPTVHEPVLSLISPKITREDNERLDRPITREELKEALFQMHPDKAPGPDGFNPAFYQHFWDLCGDDIFEAAKEWLGKGYFPSSLNKTNICLIPKSDNPTTMKDLRPISLCNVLYKMISKLLANRLKECLDKCVSEEQSAFIEGRSILDNALIAMEVFVRKRTLGLNSKVF